MRYDRRVLPTVHKHGRELSLEEAREILPQLDVIEDVILVEALCYCPTHPCLGEFVIVKELEEDDVYPTEKFNNYISITFWSVDYDLVKEFQLN